MYNHVPFQLVAIVCLVLVLVLFQNSLKDDPLPTTAEERRIDPEDPTKITNYERELEPMLQEKQVPTGPMA